jgi:iron complex outermembrane receptor protein
MQSSFSLRKPDLLSRTSAIVLSGIALFLAAPNAFAQDQEPAAQENVVGDIIVTAQKRSENLQDVPIAMQAYSGEQLQEAGVSRLTDITRLTPNINVVVQNALSQHIVIRGVGTNEFFGNAPSSVGLYMDEVSLNSSYLSTLGLFDMQRVEILRGPQNSLFGRNTTGGAVNYISNLPEVGGSVEGYGSLIVGMHNLLEAEGGVTLPVGQDFAVRLAGITHTRDGIWNNLDTGDDSYGDENRYSLRGTAVWEPSNATRFTLSAHHARADDQAQPQKVAGAFLNNPPLRMNDLAPFAGNIDWAGGNLNTVGDVPTVNVEGFDHFTRNWRDVWTGGSQRAELRVDGGYLKIEHDFGTVTLTSISAYDHTHAFYEEDNTANGNNTGGPNSDVLIIDQDTEYEQVSQEIRLASDDDDARFRWILGAFYFNEDSTLAQDIRFGTNGFPGAHPSAVGITPPGLFDVIPNPYPNTLSFSIADLEDQSMSVYGQADYDLTDRLTLTLGLRYTEDNKRNPSYFAGAFDITGADPATFYGLGMLRQLTVGLSPCLFGQGIGLPFQNNCATLDTPATDPTVRGDMETGELGGRIGLQYHVSDDVMLYANYSRGFKSGKFDLEFLHTRDTPFPRRPLDVETLDSYEIGFKSTLYDRTLLFNGAIFFNVWQDQQVFNVGVNGPEFFNLPESQVLGAEFELNWIPAENWVVTAGVGLLNSEITDATGINFDLGQGDFQEGHELPLSPELTWNASIERAFHIGENELTLQTDFRYQSASKVKYSPQVPIDEYDSRFEINARADYRFGSALEHMISLYGRNLTSERYCNEIQDLRGVAGSFYCVPNEGEAQLGLQFRTNF